MRFTNQNTNHLNPVCSGVLIMAATPESFLTQQKEQVRVFLMYKKLCAFMGAQFVLFDNSVRFVEDTVKLNASYRFIFGGFLLFLAHRQTPYTIHSHPWFYENLVVLSLYDGAKNTFGSSDPGKT